MPIKISLQIWLVMNSSLFTLLLVVKISAGNCTSQKCMLSKRPVYFNFYDSSHCFDNDSCLLQKD